MLVFSTILDVIEKKHYTTTSAGALQFILPALSLLSVLYWKSLILRKHIVPENCDYQF